MKGDFAKRVLGPALIPLGAFAFIGVLVLGFSRILLAVPKDGSVVIGVLMAIGVLFGAGAVAKGGGLKGAQRIALVAFGVLLLGGGVAAGLSIGTRPIEGHLQVAATITAQNITFDKPELDLPAAKPFLLEFINKDSVSHNVAIYDKDPTKGPAKAFFQPALTPGPKIVKFAVNKGIPAGVWFFRCDAHPVMNGIARVGGAKGPGPGGPGPGPAPSGPSPSGPPSSPPPGGGAAAGTLVAKNFAFDKHALAFVANAPAAVEIDNQDAGIPHNFALYRDAAYSDRLYNGDPVTGPGRKRYEFRAPGPGTYYFQCFYHPVPAMRGTVTVT